MKSVTNNEYTFIIKNSKFICCIYPILEEKEIEQYLEEVKIKYPNATHYCYAYILNQIRHESDDGEPSGTAGIPMLQVLEKNNLNQVLCIVVRYFGKIKLGAGGLIRAYTKVVTSCLENHIVTLKKGFSIELIFNYNEIKNIDYLLKNEKIISKNFDNEITYYAIVSKETMNCLKGLNISLTILKTVYY